LHAYATGAALRTAADRLRHAISFEIIGWLIAIPLAAWVFEAPMHDIGVLTIISSFAAVAWNYLYNLGFDHAMQRWRGTTLKTPVIRVFHAAMFEAGLLAALLPFFAWYMEIGVWEAFVMDISFSAFYFCYAYVFNWTYDWLFPLPEWKKP
jgi:uncharacterized membrane protein